MGGREGRREEKRKGGKEGGRKDEDFEPVLCLPQMLSQGHQERRGWTQCCALWGFPRHTPQKVAKTTFHTFIAAHSSFTALPYAGRILFNIK
jgi:hypothetical protein